jgi:phosphopantetheinyl transferase
VIYGNKAGFRAGGTTRARRGLAGHAPTLAELAEACATPADACLCACAADWASTASLLPAQGPARDAKPGLQIALVPLSAADAWLPREAPGRSAEGADRYTEAKRLLTEAEAARLARQRPRRQRTFVAGRLALKILAARWGHVPPERPARAVQTCDPAHPRHPAPLCGVGPGAPAWCSLAHDAGYAVAVAADRPVGVDIEVVSERLERLAPRFATAAERQRVAGETGPSRTGPFQTSDAVLSPRAALARVWTVKEAMVKAVPDLSLAAAFRQVELSEIGRESSVVVHAGRRYGILHVELPDPHPGARGPGPDHLLSVVVDRG